MRTLIVLPLAALLACAGTKINHNTTPHSSGESRSQASSVPRLVTVYDPSLESYIEVRDYHWSAVRPKVTVAPNYPTEAKKLRIEGRCQVLFYIDESGTPLSIDIAEDDDCPSVFHSNALKAANKWRFEPMEADGKAVKATFTLKLRFKIK